jgi:hypothetical protein
MQEVTAYSRPPPALFSLLRQHIPHSLPLLRRLEFTHFPNGITEHTKILWASASPLAVDCAAAFVAGYLDLSRGPETELWLYASVEHRDASVVSLFSEPAAAAADASESSEVDEARQCGALAAEALRQVKRFRNAYSTERAAESTVLVGTLSEKLRLLLTKHNVVFPRISLWDKWLFRVDELPEAQKTLEPGMRWDRVVKADIPLVLSRTAIKRKE